ncbi:MAG: integrase arm-type DNA-binding domain-containing protein [Steroidobacteraceae bacterium]
MALTELAVKSARPKDKPYKLFDERGLYLLVERSGGRLWRFKYSVAGREKLISLGNYPDVPLKRAREKRDEARRLVADGIDPSAKRQAEKAAQVDTFEAIGREWMELQRKRLTPRTFERNLRFLEEFLYPYLGRSPIATIKAPELLAVLKRVEARGFHETAHRVRAIAGCVFRYGIATGRAERDLSADLRGALAPVVTKNRAAITDPLRIGDLLRAIDAYRGQPTTEAALKLAPLTFVRPGELRGAEWKEFDLDKEEPEWRIPSTRMKMRDEHIVPLSRQAVAILREIEPLTGGGRYVFPSLRGGHRPISENTVNVALRNMGYSGQEMTGHGFRAMASTCLNERGVAPDLIELQLAHAERDEVRAAYNRSKRMADRRKMMQEWADYLDGLRVARKAALDRAA